jgi:hypothetical protein
MRNWRACRWELVAASVILGACAPSAQVKQARSATYSASYDQVWAAAIAALRDEYPIAKVVDKDARRIVTCWRPIDHDEPLASTQSAGSGWRLFRVIVEISPQAPYRVGVSGRAAEFRAPVVHPYAEGDLATPGWKEPRTDRLIVSLYEQLKTSATITTDETPAPADADGDEALGNTCIIHPDVMRIDTPGMRGIAIGDKGAMRPSP